MNGLGQKKRRVEQFPGTNETINFFAAEDGTFGEFPLLSTSEETFVRIYKRTAEKIPKRTNCAFAGFQLYSNS